MKEKAETPITAKTEVTSGDFGKLFKKMEAVCNQVANLEKKFEDKSYGSKDGKDFRERNE